MKVLNPDIVVYDNIIASHKTINAWKDPGMFLMHRASAAELEGLEKIMAMEVVFEGTRGVSEKFDPLFENVYLYLGRMLAAAGAPVFAFASEFKSEKANRIRSYKGVIPKGMDQRCYIQQEVILPSAYSLIAALIRYSEDMFGQFADLFTDRFIICTADEAFFSPGTLVNIVENYMIHKSGSYLNYLELINYYCQRGDIIFRLGGDGGDRYVSIQVFYNKEQKDRILQAATSALEMLNRS